jgi:translation initiation factor IF-3
MINERVLRFRDIRVIGPEGEQIGIIQSRPALNMAREQGLDLVLVSATANPPVCRIIDYGRHKYEMDKRERENKKKKTEVKGLKIKPSIAEHDLNTNLKKALGFLAEGDKVRIVCQFRAREITHPEIGRAKLQVFIDKTADVAQVERPPTMEANQMVVVLMPKSGKGPKKDVKTQDKQDGGEAVQDHGQGKDHPAEGV